MARGFESKSVADQQANAEERRSPGGDGSTDLAAQGLRRRLELARADTQHRLDQTSDERYRAMLTNAMADLDRQIADLD